MLEDRGAMPRERSDLVTRRILLSSCLREDNRRTEKEDMRRKTEKKKPSVLEEEWEGL